MKINKKAAEKNAIATKILTKRTVGVKIEDSTVNRRKPRLSATMSSKVAAKSNPKKVRTRTYDSLGPAAGGLKIGTWSRCATHGLQYPRGESCPKCP